MKVQFIKAFITSILILNELIALNTTRIINTIGVKLTRHYLKTLFTLHLIHRMAPGFL